MWFFQIADFNVVYQVALLHIPHPTSDSLAADFYLCKELLSLSLIKELVENI